MRFRTAVGLLLLAINVPVFLPAQNPQDDTLISPSRPVPKGKAPTMQSKLVKDAAGEQVYAIIFHKGDEVLSGLTDFAIAHKISDAHFTAIGASSGATVAWLNLPKKMYRPITVNQQVEVLSLIGDIAMFNGVPIVHMHAVLGKPDGSTVGGHVLELNTDPTIEVFLTADSTVLQKKPDEASGMKFIDPTQ